MRTNKITKVILLACVVGLLALPQFVATAYAGVFCSSSSSFCICNSSTNLCDQNAICGLAFGSCCTNVANRVCVCVSCC